MSDAAPPRTQCLTDRELDTLRGAPAGRAPEALARHLAGCERCQERALLEGRPERPAGRARPALPTPSRALFLLALMAAVIAAFFYTLRLLVGGF